MRDIKPLVEKISNTCLSIFVILSVILLNKIDIAFGSYFNWIEISKTATGIQYFDRDSLTNKDSGIIEIATKYIRIDADSSKEIEENIYIMRINCLTNKYKDISVNGKNNLYTKWKAPNGDKLLNDVISNSCKNV